MSAQPRRDKCRPEPRTRRRLLRVAAHKWLAEQCAFEFDPLVTVDEALLQLSMMNLPVPNQKIEVMDSGNRRFCMSYLFSRTWGGLRDRERKRH
jgi:hypothetical protein